MSNKEPYDLECLYCGLRAYFRDTNWREGSRRCPRCNDSNFKELKKTNAIIDTYPKGFDESIKEWKEKNSKANQEDKKADNEEIDGLDFGKYFGYD